MGQAAAIVYEDLARGNRDCLVPKNEPGPMFGQGVPFLPKVRDGKGLVGNVYMNAALLALDATKCLASLTQIIKHLNIRIFQY